MPEVLSNVTQNILEGSLHAIFSLLYFLKLQKMLWMSVDNHLTILEEYYKYSC